MTHSIELLLREMVQKGASDMHLKAGSKPGLRIDGDLVPQEEHHVLTPEATADLCRQMMTKEQFERFSHEHDLDFAFAMHNLARFRVNAMMQRGSCGLVIRQVPDEIPNAKALGLPQICIDLAAKPRGLVLVTGPTGSGKSTTLAAMIDHVNSTEHGHILTMEDPLEFVHKDKKCFVTQRQIGQDCTSFKEGLRRALRQDPDVILIGEMRDLETISMAITAAETGHLVFGTLHTTSAISTVDRIVDVFPTDAQTQVRVQLSGTLQGIVSQTLVAKVGGGRIAAREILVATDAVKAIIREAKTPQIVNLMQTGKQYGMTTLEDELIRLAQEGLITPDDAVSKANRPDDVRKRVSDLPSAGKKPASAGGAPGFSSGEMAGRSNSQQAAALASRFGAPSAPPTAGNAAGPGGLKVRMPGR